AEVALPDEREPREVVERLDGGPAEPLALEGDALHGEAERLLQPPELEARAARSVVSASRFQITPGAADVGALGSARPPRGVDGRRAPRAGSGARAAPGGPARGRP